MILLIKIYFMSIIYTVIARNNDVVLVEFSSAIGNFPVFTRNILNKAENVDKISYSYSDRYQYYFFIYLKRIIKLYISY